MTIGRDVMSATIRILGIEPKIIEFWIEHNLIAYTSSSYHLVHFMKLGVPFLEL